VIAMKKLVLAVGAAAFLGSAPFVFAADMPMKALPPPVSPMTDWSGFYIGVHGGYGWNGTNDWSTGSELIGSSGLSGGSSWDALKGPLAGGQIGYNWQVERLVFGVQGDGSWANIRGSAGNPLNLVDARSLARPTRRLSAAQELRRWEI
jgi:outer membrane immunogenic protein